MLKAKFKNMYRKQGTGNPVFVYTVYGTAAELQQYEEAQGERLRTEDDGTPLFFSSRALSFDKNAKVDLIITGNGSVVADETDKVFTRGAMLEHFTVIEEAKILAKKNLGIAIGEEAPTVAKQPVAANVAAQAKAAVGEPANQEASEHEDDDLPS